MGRRREVRHRLGTEFGRGRARVCPVSDGGSVGCRGRRRVALAERLRLGLHPVPLRSLGLADCARMVLDPGPRLRACLGDVAYRLRGIRLRRLGPDASELHLDERLCRRLRLGSVDPLVVLPDGVLLLAVLAELHRSRPRRCAAHRPEHQRPLWSRWSRWWRGGGRRRASPRSRCRQWKDPLQRVGQGLRCRSTAVTEFGRGRDPRSVGAEDSWQSRRPGDQASIALELASHAGRTGHGPSSR